MTRLAELTGRRVVLLGLGADVLAAVDAILASGPLDLRVVESGPAAAESPFPVVPLAEAAADADVFVRSPGFPRYQAPLVAARERGAAMTTPLDLWVGTYGPSRTVVAITGTKGKSTVTSLVGSLAARRGIDVGVAGNLGIPAFSDGWEHEAPVIVLEVSSYQAADLHHVPDVAVLTFLSEDHLSWHGGVAAYVADKLRVLVNEGGIARLILLPGAGGGRAVEAVAELATARSEVLPVERVAAPASSDPTVPGHRLQNAALAAAVVEAIGGGASSTDEIEDLARSSLPGRLDTCAGPEGLLCLDDALASNPSAAAAGLAWLRSLGRPTVILLGGTDRGVDPQPLADEVSRWRAGLLRAVALPESGSDLAARCGVELVGVARDVAEAVGLALAALGPEPGVVVLSPGAPTPPAVGNWEDRSRQFRQALSP